MAAASWIKLLIFQYFLNVALENGEILMDDIPNDGVVNSKIIVNQPIPKAF